MHLVLFLEPVVQKHTVAITQWDAPFRKADKLPSGTLPIDTERFFR